MAEHVDILIGGQSSGAVTAIDDVDGALDKLTPAAAKAAGGVSVLGNRVDALSAAESKARGSAAELAASHGKLEGSAFKAGGAVGLLNQKLRNLDAARQHARALTADVDALANKAVAAGAALAGIGGAAFLAFSTSSLELAIERLNVEQSLAAQLHSEVKAQQEIAKLQKVAASPGVDFGPAAQAYLTFRSLKLQGGLAVLTIEELGNAAAQAKDPVQAFESSLMGLSGILGKNKVQGDDLTQQILAQSPLLRDSLEKAFGTAVPEQLQKQIEKLGISIPEFIQRWMTEAAKGARAADGPANAIQNLKVQWDQTKIAFGTGLIAGDFQANLNKLTGKLQDLEQPLGELGEKLNPLIDELLDFAGKALDGETATGKLLATMLAAGPAVLLFGGAALKAAAWVTELRLTSALLATQTATTTPLLAKLSGLLGGMGPVGWAAAAAVGAVAVGVHKLNDAQDDARDSAHGYNEMLDDMAEKGRITRDEMKSLRLELAKMPSMWANVRVAAYEAVNPLAESLYEQGGTRWLPKWYVRLKNGEESWQEELGKPAPDVRPEGTYTPEGKGASTGTGSGTNTSAAGAVPTAEELRKQAIEAAQFQVKQDERALAEAKVRTARGDAGGGRALAEAAADAAKHGRVFSRTMQQCTLATSTLAKEQGLLTKTFTWTPDLMKELGAHPDKFRRLKPGEAIPAGTMLFSPSATANSGWHSMVEGKDGVVYGAPRAGARYQDQTKLSVLPKGWVGYAPVGAGGGSSDVAAAQRRLEEDKARLAHLQGPEAAADFHRQAAEAELKRLDDEQKAAAKRLKDEAEQQKAAAREAEQAKQEAIRQADQAGRRNVTRAEAELSLARERLDILKALGANEREQAAGRAAITAARENVFRTELDAARGVVAAGGEQWVVEQKLLDIQQARMQAVTAELERRKQVAEEQQRQAEEQARQQAQYRREWFGNRAEWFGMAAERNPRNAGAQGRFDQARLAQAAELQRQGKWLDAARSRQQVWADQQQRRMAAADERVDLADIAVERAKLLGYSRDQIELYRRQADAARAARMTELVAQGKLVEAQREYNDLLAEQVRRQREAADERVNWARARLERAEAVGMDSPLLQKQYDQARVNEGKLLLGNRETALEGYRLITEVMRDQTERQKQGGFQLPAGPSTGSGPGGSGLADRVVIGGELGVVQDILNLASGRGTAEFAQLAQPNTNQFVDRLTRAVKHRDERLVEAMARAIEGR